jgi:hypothetical protein
MSNWISWQELLDQWKIEEFELLDILKQGLRPYSKYGNAMPCPKGYHLILTKSLELDQIKADIDTLRIIERVARDANESKEINPSIRAGLIDRKKLSNFKFFLDNYRKSKGIKIKSDEDENYLVCYNISLFQTVEGTGGYQQSRPCEERIRISFREMELSKTILKKLNEERKKISKKLDDIKKEDPKYANWKYFVKPSSDNKTELILSVVREAIFIGNQVAQFEKDFSLTSTEEKPEKTNKELLPCKRGTRWEDVKITLIENGAVKIETPEGSRRFSYHELGLANIKSGKPKIGWHILKLFAIYSGRLDDQIEESAKRILLNDFNIDYYRKLPNYTKRLNKHLKEFFGIKDSIFKYHYKKSKAYITKIIFSDRRYIDKLNSNDFNEKTLHQIETEDIQDKHGIPISKRVDI